MGIPSLLDPQVAEEQLGILSLLYLYPWLAEEHVGILSLLDPQVAEEQLAVSPVFWTHR